jgi:uncharacterized protein YndB with AHSA1/START domain
VYELYIKATPEQIWDAITKSEFRRQYFHGSSVESTFEPGTPIRTLSPKGDLWGDNVVLESEAPRKLVHTWRSLYNPEFAVEPESRVTWEIEPQGDGSCKFTLTHDHLEESPKTAANVRGWLRIVSGMKTVIETGAPMIAAG